MQRALANLRKLPDDEKVRLARTIAIAVTLVLALVYLITLLVPDAPALDDRIVPPYR